MLLCMKPNWFIALPVSAGDWFAPLVADAPAGVRRFHPDDLHATVAFLGACGRPAALAAWRSLDALAHPPIRARLGVVRPMGNRRRPSAFSVTFTEGNEPLSALIGAWRTEALAIAGARPATRPPLPHVTVARPPRRAADGVREAGLAWMRSRERVGVQVVIDRVALYTWSEDRRSRLFTIVEERTL